ncbi:MAG: flagellar basal-body MS-ring/collar protein FliF [bacterium]|jgi:flagellar M-ring protein FliF
MDLFNQFRQQVAELWGRLNRAQKIIIGGSIVLLPLCIVIGTSLFSSQRNYVPLFTQLEANDAGEVVAKLDEMNVSYALAEGGSAVLVPGEAVYETRLALAREGLPKGSVVGFEIFDRTALGTTDFVRRVQYIRGLQGELTRTIRQIDGVEEVSVHIVLPEESLYTQQKKQATAAVLLNLRAGAALEQQQVRGIVHLISRSVEGLLTDNITVIDDSGRILSNGFASEADTATGILTLSQMEMQNTVQEELEHKLQSMLEQVLGPGNVVARVNAELNFDQKTVSRRFFEPVEGEGVLRSIEELHETFRGTGTPPDTAAGTPGIPGYPAADGGSSEFSHSETTMNFEISETTENMVVAPGSIKRLSVAVMLNREQLTAQEQTVIENAVASTIGVDLARSDQITVAAFPFDTSLVDTLREELRRQAEPGGMNARTAVTVGVALALLLLLFGLFRMMARRRQIAGTGEVLVMGEMAEPSFAAEAEVAATAQEAPAAKLQGEIEKLIRLEPEEAAKLVKAWLGEDQD